MNMSQALETLGARTTVLLTCNSLEDLTEVESTSFKPRSAFDIDHVSYRKFQTKLRGSVISGQGIRGHCKLDAFSGLPPSCRDLCMDVSMNQITPTVVRSPSIPPRGGARNHALSALKHEPFGPLPEHTGNRDQNHATAHPRRYYYKATSRGRRLAALGTSFPLELRSRQDAGRLAASTFGPQGPRRSIPILRTCHSGLSVALEGP